MITETYVTKAKSRATVFQTNSGFGEYNVPIIDFGTTCCAMSILSAKDYHTFDELQKAIAGLKKQSLSQKWRVEDRSGGERNIMCIISPGEENLEANLVKLGFKLLTKEMPRRKGYPPGLLKMYLLSF